MELKNKDMKIITILQDPEEFLNGLVAQLLRAEPFLKLSSGQEAYCYQLFVEKDEHVTLPSVQQLLEQSFATSGVKLSEVYLCLRCSINFKYLYKSNYMFNFVNVC